MNRPAVEVEAGSLGRILVVRLLPNEDLVEGIIKACAGNGVGHAIVRGGIGSLTDASLEYGERPSGVTRRLFGPAIEVLHLQGDVRRNAGGEYNAEVCGSVSDTSGAVFGGRFQRGENPVCVTIEVVLQEWITNN